MQKLPLGDGYTLCVCQARHRKITGCQWFKLILEMYETKDL